MTYYSRKACCITTSRHRSTSHGKESDATSTRKAAQARIASSTTHLLHTCALLANYEHLAADIPGIRKLMRDRIYTQYHRKSRWVMTTVDAEIIESGNSAKVLYEGCLAVRSIGAWECRKNRYSTSLRRREQEYVVRRAAVEVLSQWCRAACAAKSALTGRVGSEV